MQAQDIIHFWFEELNNKQLFAKDAALDAMMLERFGSTLVMAGQGELFGWRATPLGRQAEIVVLDQFSRNIYRDTPQSFAQDAQALTMAQRTFAYMPYLHSESRLIHRQALNSLPSRAWKMR